ncbi:MAG: hypothetical protein GY722_07420 [bacterium]|nr:hypothetical protein [bacterium]
MKEKRHDRTRPAGDSPWQLTLWIRSALKQELLLVDSLWPACAGELWQHLTLRDVLSDYRIALRSPAGVQTTVPFSSLDGLVNLLQGSMSPASRKGLLSTGTFAWILELDPELFSVHRCDLRFYDRYVDLAEHFEWTEIDAREQEREATLIMQAPRSILSHELWPTGEKVLALLEAALQERNRERMMSLEDEGMRRFLIEMGESLVQRLRELFPG